MPTKKNFLGAQQNYNPKNGEYEPSLVGKNGKPVKDADGDGVSHEAKKEHDFKDVKGKSETRKDKYGNSLLSDDAFKIGVEAMKKYIAKFEPMARQTPNQTAHEYLKGSNIYVDALTEAASDAIEEAGLNPNFDITSQDINEMIGAATGDEIDVENSKQEAKFDAWTGKKYGGYDPSKSSEQKTDQSKFSKFGKEKEFTGKDFLSEEHLDYLFDKFDGDENKVLDAVRADPEYQKSEITNSDLQGIVEVHTMKKSFGSINKKRMGY